ncbi:MAG: right-handed parallel beta-helix repeat-containing protein, partial [Candidatus Helarchaeota archaeon]|nr:right-handed parallel beta-helix repeat-containing protein [Candidatus Helarchaeota archaeon]
GIDLTGSSDNLLINNTINNYYFGIRLKSNSNYNSISNNTLIYNHQWIYVDESCIGNTIENNIIKEIPLIFMISWLFLTLIGLGLTILIVFKKRGHE